MAISSVDKMKKLFLDSNAHVPMSDKILQAYCNCQKSDAGHGNSNVPNAIGIEASSLIEESRGRIANLLGCKPGQLYFTRGATQACEWAMEILKYFTETLEYSSVEHSAIREACEKYTGSKKIPVDSSGAITKFDFDMSSGISVIQVQNEIGTIQPLERVKKYKDSLLFSDMCQSVGKVSINLKEMNIDGGIWGGHKFGGPVSVGILYLAQDRFWRSFGTGGRYYQDIPGTLSVADIVATAEALEETLENMPERTDRSKEFQKELEDRLINEGIRVIGTEGNRVGNTTFINIKNALSILMELGKSGIYCGLGSACSKIGFKSPTLTAIGEKDDADSYLRISQHGDYGKEEAKYFFDKFIEIVRKYK